MCASSLYTLEVTSVGVACNSDRKYNSWLFTSLSAPLRSEAEITDQTQIFDIWSTGFFLLPRLPQATSKLLLEHLCSCLSWVWWWRMGRYYCANSWNWLKLTLTLKPSSGKYKPLIDSSVPKWLYQTYSAIVIVLQIGKQIPSASTFCHLPKILPMNFCNIQVQPQTSFVWHTE